MSSPNVSGSLALLGQHAENLHGMGFGFLSATMRGLVFHTADEAGASDGLDYLHGWGLMNTERAAQLMTADSDGAGPRHIYELQLQDGGTENLEVYSDGLGPLKVTISWTDPAAVPRAPAVDDTTPMLVNDLDLRVIDQSSTTYLPWVLDPSNPGAAATKGANFRDNSEQVLNAAPAAGLHTINITHKGLLKDGIAQSVSLIVSGNVPIPVDLDLDGIPDTFENQNGLDQLDPGDAGLDPDDDGLTNLEEFEKQTDPIDPDSDDDEIIDGLDRMPKYAGNALGTCVSPHTSLNISVYDTVTCGASESITTIGVVGVEANANGGYGDLLMISPVVRLRPGFSVVPGAKLSVISQDPTPLAP